MSTQAQANLPGMGRRRLEAFWVFFRIGALGFGGVAGIWGLIQAEVQERRNWLSKESFLDGLALVQALPGATAVQMCIYAGAQRAGLWGGVLAGLGFILPAFAIMLVLAALHSAYGALPFMRDAFYGIGPVVLGIFIVAAWRLARNAIKDRFGVLIGVAAAGALLWSPLGPGGVFLLAGCIGVALYHSRKAGLLAGLAVAMLIAAERCAAILLPSASASGPAGAGLWDIGWFFFKVGALTFGGGLTIIAFIQDQVVNQLHWITAQQFLDALAIGQVTPGPVIMLAAFVGYKVAGLAGAVVAGCAIFLPSFILMLCVLPMLNRVRAMAWTRAAMRAIGPAVVGAVGLTIAQLAPQAARDVFTGIVLVVTVPALLVWRVPPISATVAGGLLGILARSRLAMRLRDLT